MKRTIFFVVFLLCASALFGDYHLPEIYQDVLIQGKVVQSGVRSCEDRYMAIQAILQSLPLGFKALDIGASQGYFSFKMAAEFNAQCVMIEDGYSMGGQVWETADYLKYLCEQNYHLKNLTLLKKKVFLKELGLLKELEKFNVVLAFSVIHHMKKDVNEPHDVYLPIIDAILALAPVVLIENPINTGDHTLFIREALIKRGGKLVYQSSRGTLTYEIYLFDRRDTLEYSLACPNINYLTYKIFNGCYTNVVGCRAKDEVGE